MSSKIDKLNELGELLKSGALTKDEFESLKKEILNSNETNNGNQKVEEKQSIIIDANGDKEKIILKSFFDSDNKRVSAPSIESINLKNITKDEINILKPFIRLKQIHAPSEMTSDEIKIGNKLFTILEISKMNSERTGFNYAFSSILSLLTASAALYFILLSPCMIYLGAGSGGLASFVIALSTLAKPDATKLDKTVCYISIVLLVVALIIFKSTW